MPTDGVQMEHYELGVALAVTRIVELRRQADQRRLASRMPGRTGDRHRGQGARAAGLPDQHGQAADCAGGGRAATATAASGPGRGTTAAATLRHHYEPGVFDADHCRACARQTGLLDHYRRVQQEEVTLGRPTGGRVRPAGAPVLRCGRPVPRSYWLPRPC
jgi:hypothetical protein